MTDVLREYQTALVVIAAVIVFAPCLIGWYLSAANKVTRARERADRAASRNVERAKREVS